MRWRLKPWKGLNYVLTVFTEESSGLKLLEGSDVTKNLKFPDIAKNLWKVYCSFRGVSKE